MFRIDRDANTIQLLKKRNFSELGFNERGHLQDWIAKHPSCLGEDLLIVSKEFAGFSDTQERLDLLALDKKGRIVIIENKLDDSGRDVTWQALKYASYCACLKTEDICGIYQKYMNKIEQNGNAAEYIANFIEVDDLSEFRLNRSVTQRIILIAANFRKEVTSTVLWLMNFNLQIQCFKVTPWSMDEDLFLNVEQIIPVKDTQDLVISLADKTQDEVRTPSATQAIIHAFWTEVIDIMQEKSNLYDNISPRTAKWIDVSSGVDGVTFNFAASQKYGCAEVYIGRKEKVENEAIFDELISQRSELEEVFGGPLEWKRQDEKAACRIRAETEGNMLDRDAWPEMMEFMTDAMVRIEKTGSSSVCVGRGSIAQPATPPQGGAQTG